MLPSISRPPRRHITVVHRTQTPPPSPSQKHTRIHRRRCSPLLLCFCFCTLGGILTTTNYLFFFIKSSRSCSGFNVFDVYTFCLLLSLPFAIYFVALNKIGNNCKKSYFSYLIMIISPLSLPLLSGHGGATTLVPASALTSHISALEGVPIYLVPPAGSVCSSFVLRFFLLLMPKIQILPIVIAQLLLHTKVVESVELLIICAAPLNCYGATIRLSIIILWSSMILWMTCTC